MARYRKFGSVMTTVDGIKFRSKAEAYRYGELKMMEKAGLIRSLQLQPAYVLSVENGCYPDERGRQIDLGKYVADFRYERFQWPGKSKECETVIEDVKGFKTPLYRWKKKHVEAQYGITVTEVK